MYYKNWALIIPLANEEKDFKPFIDMVKFVIEVIPPGNVYLIVDEVSNCLLYTSPSPRDDR